MGSYHELITIPTIEERLNYLRNSRRVGESIWGHGRYFNQAFYRSQQWQHLRHKIIIRDNGNDLAMEGYPAGYRAIVHHINPITLEQLEREDPAILDPDNLILCGFQTHNMIHSGLDGQTPFGWTMPVRTANDTCPWR